MKIYTRTGDLGETGLLNGARVSKSAPRVDAYGEVDELNACLGLVVSGRLDTDLRDMILSIQRKLFSLGAELAAPSRNPAETTKASVGTDDVERLESWIDHLETELASLRQFILPGGDPTAAAIHLARAVCRRAERRMVGLGSDAVTATSIAYINRLSDLLFVLARAINARAGITEEKW